MVLVITDFIGETKLCFCWAKADVFSLIFIKLMCAFILSANILFVMPTYSLL